MLTTLLCIRTPEVEAEEGGEERRHVLDDVRCRGRDDAAAGAGQAGVDSRQGAADQQGGAAASRCPGSQESHEQGRPRRDAYVTGQSAVVVREDMSREEPLISSITTTKTKQ